MLLRGLGLGLMRQIYSVSQQHQVTDFVELLLEARGFGKRAVSVAQARLVAKFDLVAPRMVVPTESAPGSLAFP